MAKIMYQRENNLLLEPREAFYRPFNFGEWTELRIGMLFRFVSTTSDSSSILTETLGVNNETDRFYFGIKDSGNTMPGVAGTKFIGLGTVSGSMVKPSSQVSNGGAIFESASFYERLYFSAYSGSSFRRPLLDNTSIQTAPFFSGSASGSNYNAYLGLKFVLQNSGAANQQVELTYRRDGHPTLVGSSSADLNAFLSSPLSWTSPSVGTISPTSVADWATGIPLPDSFFVYSPMYNNRLRLSAIQVLKIS